ncbi:hypothetical protein [Candidatus Poriferisodalis sp.]|uniref:hypothetical protein n=1 Tax=Candidatus Poriferisodalis sp. TaxID=3101277 RepID=UPI003B02DA8F
MSAPILSLALATMCALFSAAAADTAQALGLRNQAADQARRVATATLDACALSNSATRQCAPPPGCAAPACTVCRRGDAVRADVSLDWAPVMLRGLTPARGRHALSLEALDVADLSGAGVPACA